MWRLFRNTFSSEGIRATVGSGLTSAALVKGIIQRLLPYFIL